MAALYQDVTRLTSSDIRRISKSLSELPVDASSMEEMAEAIVGHLYDVLRPDPGSHPQCALVRLFKTCAPEELTYQLQKKLPIGADESYRSLVLLATRGHHPDWNSRRMSHNHQLISLESTEVVQSIPMISNLISMLGLNLSDVVKPDPELNIAGFYPLSVFYVDEAKDSPFIPAKDDFVIPYDIHTVVGFGSLLSFSDMFTIIMFFQVPISREVATLFRNLAEDVHKLLQPFHDSGVIFKVDE